MADKLLPSKLSVVLATRNEEENIERCLNSVTDLASEIIIFDEYSKDKTRDIAQKLGARVYLEPHHEIFHITKQKALDKAMGDWILQLDADEVVTSELKSDIKKVLRGETIEIKDARKTKLFLEHQRLIEIRDGKIGVDTDKVVGYFIARKNMFLGKPLTYAGVYPDGVVRLVKKGFARFPQKSVHEQIQLDGKVGWLNGDLLHYDSPTLKRYLQRMNRYTELHAFELRISKLPKNFRSFIRFTILYPVYYFLKLYVRHRGFLDGVRGFLWSFFSALHFPIAYFKYVTDNSKDDKK